VLNVLSKALASLLDDTKTVYHKLKSISLAMKINEPVPEIKKNSSKN
jgi:hypothetical protein